MGIAIVVIVYVTWLLCSNDIEATIGLYMHDFSTMKDFWQHVHFCHQKGVFCVHLGLFLLVLGTLR